MESWDAYAWSSAAEHCGRSDERRLLDLDFWKAGWTATSWRHFQSDAAEDAGEGERIRRNTHTGRPLGSEEFVRKIERTLCRALAPQKGGQPSKQPLDSTQEWFDFAITE